MIAKGVLKSIEEFEGKEDKIPNFLVTKGNRTYLLYDGKLVDENGSVSQISIKNEKHGKSITVIADGIFSFSIDDDSIYYSGRRMTRHKILKEKALKESIFIDFKKERFDDTDIYKYDDFTLVLL